MNLKEQAKKELLKDWKKEELDCMVQLKILESGKINADKEKLKDIDLALKKLIMVLGLTRTKIKTLENEL